MITVFTEFNHRRNNYADGYAYGILLGDYMLIGFQLYLPGDDGRWLAGPIIFNMSIGLFHSPKE